MPFTNKLEGVARAGGVAELAEKAQADTMTWGRELDTDEDGSAGEPPISELPMNILCSPAKRPSLPESWKIMPETSWLSREMSGGNGQLNLGTEIGATSSQLHRQLMMLRLQNRRAGLEQGKEFIHANSLSFNIQQRHLFFRNGRQRCL